MKNRFECPYCMRKIKYFSRITEHNMGEHKCTHCKKISNIKQQSGIWLLLILISIAALSIMLFYFMFADAVTNEYMLEGKHKILMFLFFGDLKEVKWLIWEFIPFVLFYFLSPQFMSFIPQQKYMEQTTTSIDLPKPTLKDTQSINKKGVSGSTRVIPKADESEYSKEYEEISSSSGIDKTRAFDVSELSDLKLEENREEKVNIITPSTSVSSSYKSDVPLRRIFPEERETVTVHTETYPQKVEQITKKQPEKTLQGNYSANRKF